MICPNCGNELPQDSVFCGFCGAKVIPDYAASPDNSATADQPVDPFGNPMQGQPPFNPMPGAYPPMGQPPMQEPEPKRYTWVWFVIPAVIGLAVLLFFLLKGSGDSSPGQTAATDSLKTEQPAVKDKVKDEPADTIGQQGAVQVSGNEQPPKQQEETREIVEDEEEDDDDDWRTPKSSSSKSEQGDL